MSLVRFYQLSAVIIGFLLPFISFAGDPLWQLTHGHQDVLALIHITAVKGATAEAEPLFFFPQTKQRPQHLSLLETENWATRGPLEVNKNYLASLKSVGRNSYTPEWALYEITGTRPEDAMLTRLSSGDDAALQAFIRSGGKETEFVFIENRAYVRHTNGEEVQIYPGSPLLFSSQASPSTPFSLKPFGLGWFLGMSSLFLLGIITWVRLKHRSAYRNRVRDHF